MSKSRLSAALSRIGLIGVLMGMTLLPRAYTQQEVDPTWFNPWPAAGKEGPHSMHPRPTNKPHRRKVTALAPGQLHTESAAATELSFIEARHHCTPGSVRAVHSSQACQ
jgi:hypothetical protein